MVYTEGNSPQLGPEIQVSPEKGRATASELFWKVTGRLYQQEFGTAAQKVTPLRVQEKLTKAKERLAKMELSWEFTEQIEVKHRGQRVLRKGRDQIEIGIGLPEKIVRKIRPDSNASLGLETSRSGQTEEGRPFEIRSSLGAVDEQTELQYAQVNKEGRLIGAVLTFSPTGGVTHTWIEGEPIIVSPEMYHTASDNLITSTENQLPCVFAGRIWKITKDGNSLQLFNSSRGNTVEQFSKRISVSQSEIDKMLGISVENLVTPKHFEKTIDEEKKQPSEAELAELLAKIKSHVEITWENEAKNYQKINPEMVNVEGLKRGVLKKSGVDGSFFEIKFDENEIRLILDGGKKGSSGLGSLQLWMPRPGSQTLFNAAFNSVEDDSGSFDRQVYTYLPEYGLVASPATKIRKGEMQQMNLSPAEVPPVSEMIKHWLEACTQTQFFQGETKEKVFIDPAFEQARDELYKRFGRLFEVMLHRAGDGSKIDRNSATLLSVGDFLYGNGIKVEYPSDLPTVDPTLIIETSELGGDGTRYLRRVEVPKRRGLSGGIEIKDVTVFGEGEVREKTELREISHNSHLDLHDEFGTEIGPGDEVKEEKKPEPKVIVLESPPDIKEQIAIILSQLNFLEGQLADAPVTKRVFRPLRK